MSVSYGGDSITFADGSTVSNGWQGFKNKVINGAMMVAQRASTATVANTSNYYVCDRTYCWNDGLGSQTWNQSTDAPTGFFRSMEFLCATAKTTLTTSDHIRMRFNMESGTLMDLNTSTGTSTLALSFWVKSNKVGTYVVGAIKHSSVQRHVFLPYTINQANVWEYKTIVVPEDSTGSIPYNTDMGLSLDFVLAAGPTYKSGSQATTWATRADGNVAPSQTVNIVDTTSNYFRITGLQLEKGSVSSSFEHRSYTTELNLCQRYFEVGVVLIQGYGNGTNGVFGSQSFKTVKRATPTITNKGASYNNITVNTMELNVPGASYADNYSTIYDAILTAGYSTAPSTGMCRYRGIFTADAEL